MAEQITIFTIKVHIRPEFREEFSDWQAKMNARLAAYPGFTSLIGKVKFSRRYGLSTHHAAALTIGRRYLSERIPRHLEVPDGKSGHVALSLPARNRARMVSMENHRSKA